MRSSNPAPIPQSAPPPKWLILMLAAAIALPTTAQEPDGFESRIAAITAQFQEAYDKGVGEAHDAAIADLDAKYLGALKRTLDDATAAGNLEEALALRTESDRISQKLPLPAVDLESLPDSLKQLRGTYRAALAKLDADLHTAAQPYYDHYDRLLEALQVELTQSQQLDAALAVKAKRDAIKADRNPASTATITETTSPTEPTPPPLDDDSQKALIDWIFSHQGEITLTTNGGKITVKDAGAIPSGKNTITRVRLNGSQLKDRDLERLVSIPTLEGLIVFGKSTFTSLAPLSALKGLLTLDLSSNSGLKESEVTHLAGLKQLNTLLLRLDDATGEHFGQLAGNEHLQNLYLYNGELTEQGGQELGKLVWLRALKLENFMHSSKQSAYLASIGRLPELTSLGLPNNRLEAEAFAHIATLKKLKYLTLSNSQIDNAGFSFLAPLAGTLTNLDMQNNATVSDEGIRHIVATLPNLESISVSIGSTCTGEAIQELAKLPRLKTISWWVKGMKDKDYLLLAALPAIERITLNGTAITDDGLAAFPTCKSLSSLNLSGNAITDKGLPHIEAIQLLKYVTLTGTQVSDAGIAQLQKARPDLKIQH